jgi:hypothetical protein
MHASEGPLVSSISSPVKRVAARTRCGGQLVTADSLRFSGCNPTPSQWPRVSIALGTLRHDEHDVKGARPHRERLYRTSHRSSMAGSVWRLYIGDIGLLAERM